MSKPNYYKSQWNNCYSCRIHYMSELPHLKAYLCDDCWNKMPHYKVSNLKSKPKMKKENKEEWTQLEWVIYMWACLIVMSFTLGYMLLK